MQIKVITKDSSKDFELAVAQFLAKMEDVIFHEKTVYGITQESHWSEGDIHYKTVYSAIFQFGKFICEVGN